MKMFTEIKTKLIKDLNNASRKLLLLLILVIIFIPAVGQAQLKEKFAESLQTTGQGTGHIDSSGNETFFSGKTLPGIIGSVVGIALSLLGVFFLGLIIYAGYNWMIARGNAQEVEKAKNTIINAVIGLVVVLAAYAVTTYISSLF